jgi:alkylation response protein AidB-like acyl-CoA dehydrogenase
MDFVRQHAPISRTRAQRDSGDPTGFSRACGNTWRKLGWTGILVPEEHGGANMGLADLAVVLEALGRTVAPEPFLSTVLLAGQLLTRGQYATKASLAAWHRRWRKNPYRCLPRGS